MIRRNSVTHVFVEGMPDELEDGVIYVSIPYATAVHKCCCGCGREVVTPFTPTDWRLVFDGETISLDPSIGNWNFDCQSHYWIERNRILWDRRWTRQEIDAGRTADRAAKAAQFGRRPHETDGEATPQRAGLLQRVMSRLRR